MGIFDIFKKKAEISIVLEKETFSYGEKIKGKVIINPLEDFTSNKLIVGIVIDQFEKYYEKLFFPGTNFYKGSIVEISFEFDFFEYEFLENLLWADAGIEKIKKEQKKDDIVIGVGSYSIYSHFDIPGINLREQKEITLITE